MSDENIQLMMDRFRAVDWTLIYKIYPTYGNTLNENTMKPMKGRVAEFFVQRSLPTLEFVDAIGYDLICNETNVKIEVKSEHDLLLTPKRRDLKAHITFTFKNSRGDNAMTLDETNTADIYVLLQQDAIAITTRDQVCAYLKVHRADIKARIPNDYIDLLYRTPQAVQLPEEPAVNLPDIIKSIMLCVNSCIWNGGDIREQLSECLHNIAYNISNDNDQMSP